MDPTDGGSLTKIILGMAGAGGFIWAAWERWIKNKVVAANSEAQVAISAAQETVYTMMTNRLELYGKGRARSSFAPQCLDTTEKCVLHRTLGAMLRTRQRPPPLS